MRRPARGKMTSRSLAAAAPVERPKPVMIQVPMLIGEVGLKTRSIW